jgi:nucleotide-binding universal stress UspA family protein
MPTYSKILFPVDFSDRCRGASRYVEAVAGRFGSTVVMLNVVETTAHAADIDFGALAFEVQVAEKTQHYTKLLDPFLADEMKYLQVERRLEQGDPARVIIDLAQSEGVDLIMKPTHGYGGFRRFILGSVTAKVLHDAECPVWTGAHLENSPPLTDIRFRNIACAVDIAPSNVELLQTAGELTDEYGADLTVIHIVPTSDVAPARYFDTDLRNSLVREARETLQEQCKNIGVKARVCVEGGDIASYVSLAAKHHEADLLVIGRPHHTGLGRLKEHSYSIIRESPCPVLSV